jgi:hypothetical protein
MICKDCIHNAVCKYGEARSNGLYCTGEKCKQYQSTADVAPKGEVARELLSDLKKTVHDKAVYSYSKEMYPYINLKTFDAIVAEYISRLEGKR